jgi:hypothetical protein
VAGAVVQLGKRLRALQAELPLLGLWGAALVCIEVFGRRSPSEAGDLLVVAVLATLTALTVRQHASRPRSWLERGVELGQVWVAYLRRFRISMGIDLRGDPPLPRRLPPLLVWGVVGSASLVGLVWMLRALLPGGLREALITVSPTALALYHVLLWAWIGLCALVLFLMPLVFLGEALERSPRWRSARRRTHGWIGIAYAFALVVAATSLPATVPLALTGGMLVGLLALALFPRAPRITILWKPRGSAGAPAGFEWTWLVCGLGFVYLSLLASSVLLALGDRIAGPGGGATPISHFLGLALAWSLPGAYVATFHQAAWMILRGLEGQAGRRWPRVALEGPGLERDKQQARAALHGAGFDVAFADEVLERTDVRLRLVEDAHPTSGRRPPGWPRPVHLSELCSPDLHAQIQRRFEHLCRHTVARGIERAFEAVAHRRFERGTGFWVAPHCPFVTHLTRDVDESASGWIGEPWRKLIQLPARQHMRQVLDALQVDLVFIEDGVKVPELKRVLTLLFEHYDRFGPTRLEDMRLFAGIPRLRIVVHDYVLEEPYRATGYPETDHEHLGRARILHVYRDRGGDQQVAFDPANFDWMPTPPVPSLV